MRNKLSKSSIILLGLLFISSIVFAVAQSNVVNFKDYIKVEIASPLEDGNVAVVLQDQHSEVIDLKMSVVLDNLTLLGNYSIGDTLINISTTGVTPTQAMTVCLKEGTAFYQARPTSITSLGGNDYELHMDTPLDFAFTDVGGCELTSTNLAVDGSVTPVIFRITPSGLDDGTEWDITRFILLFGGEGIGPQNDAPDDGDFGVTSALTNGIVIRSVNGVTKNIYNAKTNGDMRARAYDVTYTEASKAGVYSVTTRRTFAGQDKNGVTVRLKAEDHDEFQIIIQDDLTEMIGGQMVVQGHIVEK